MKDHRFGIDVLRDAVALFDGNTESFNQKYTPEQLIKIALACWKSKWSTSPDEWTPQQVAAAILHGTPPTFEERPWIGLHATNVTDCYCLDCRREQCDYEESVGEGP